MNLSELFQLQFMMFAEMVVGYLLCKGKILTPDNRSVFSKAVIWVFLPCSIISSFNTELNMKTLRDFLIIFLVSCGVQVLCTFLARALYNRETPERKAILQYATVCSNAGFLGNAVAEGVYGETGLLYAQIYLIPLRTVMWTAGVSYFEKDSSGLNKLKKILTHPCIIALEIGLVRMLLNIPFPAAVDKTLTSLGRCSTPLIMVFLGMILYETGFSNMFKKDILSFSFLRLVVIPVCVLAGCKLCHVDSFITGLSVLLAAMPAGSTTSVLAEQYNTDVEFAANVVVATTILSVALLPIWVMILHSF